MLICLITDPLACAISFGSCVVAIFFNLKEFYLFFLTKFKCLKKSDRKSKGIFRSNKPLKGINWLIVA